MAGAAYLVYSICLVIVDDAYLARLSEIQHVGLLDVDDILNRERNLDAVAVVVRPENDPLEALDPLFGALRAVGPEIVRPVVRDDSEVYPFLVLVGDVGRNPVPQVDLATGKIEVLRIPVVGEDIALEAKPVAVVLGIPLAALG